MLPPINGKIPVHLVNQPERLLQTMQDLACCDTLSFDIEFDNNSYGYGVTLCVVQVATSQACYVIDGLADLDLSGLYALFESTNIQKIVHAPGEDLRLLHSLRCYPRNVFDTEVVARLLNYEHTSLTVLLREKLNVSMDKKLQRSNWLRRPLTQEQVEYAAEDVTWLHPLKAILEAEAAEKDLLPLVREEQALLSTTIYPSVAKTDFLKPADMYSLSPQEQYIANELLRYRDDLARSMNKPAYQVMDEELLKGLATGTRLPQSILEGPGVHPRFRNNRFATQLQQQLEQLKKAAMAKNLSPQKQRRQRHTPDQHASIRQAADDKEKVFAPIKRALEQQFGSHAAKFMLSNKLVNSLLNGSITLQEVKPSYRQALIRNIAAAEGINLDRYSPGAEGG